MDDDRDVVRAIVGSLERHGYRAEGLTDPRDVLERYRAGRVPNLLLTDVVMPELSGLTLVDQLLAGKPDIRVVYMSGYLQRPVSWTGFPGAAVGFLEKPIEMVDLLDTVRQVLDRHLTPAIPDVAQS